MTTTSSHDADETTARASTTVPTRAQIPAEHRWDLTPLYASDDDWEADFKRTEARIAPLAARYRGQLGSGPDTLCQFFDALIDLERAIDRIHQYVRRHSDVDTSNAHYQGLLERSESLATSFEEATSFYRSELLALDEDLLNGWLQAPVLAPWKLHLERLLRDKPYTLSEREERILALAGELTRAPMGIFTRLNASDLNFGTITDDQGNTHEVSHGGYLAFMTHPDRRVRHDFFHTYYAAYDAHRHTLAATLVAGLKANHFGARARGFESTRHAALHRNHIPAAVYDNLVTTVRNNLAPLHRYYALNARVHRIDPMRPWDLLAPLVPGVELGRPYDQAVGLLEEALAPLGHDYVTTLASGLRGGWVDRYENRGKVSGAYSSGCYDSPPYILLNYRDDSIEQIYTLAHEAGHSMHSFYSRKHQTPQDASYSIFVAEVASTFNEILLTQHLLENTHEPRVRAAIIARELDGLRGLIYRQTMFAEYELALYNLLEGQQALGLDEIRGTYRDLLAHHLGAGVQLDPLIELESLRIPHFYFGYYVYQYATGVSAALALTEPVLAGDSDALQRYLGFLATGGSLDPIDALARAGVDMTSPEPIEKALGHFARRVEELDALLDPALAS